jgi:uncharacterized protein YkwD
MFKLHNDERKKKDIPPLTCLSNRLSAIVAKHVDYQIEKDEISHDGREKRGEEAGASSHGENTYYDMDGDPKEAVKWWMDSPGHKANILEETFTHIGISVKEAPNGKWISTTFFTDDSGPCD